MDLISRKQGAKIFPIVFRKYEYDNLTALNNNKRRFECKLTKAADNIDLLKKNR